MNIRLSYFGWMVTREMVNTGQLHLGTNLAQNLLLDLWTGVLSPASDSLAERVLLAAGLIELVDEAVSKELTALCYQRNPLAHLTKIIFEFTTICNFNCAHCYNARVPRLRETRPELLAEAADLFIQMGIRWFDFIGGEVSRYGDGWLDLVRKIRAHGDDIAISLYTNGWWLEQSNFMAAGKSYTNTAAYLDDLKASGVSHVVFSLDGPGELHDASRHHPGLYARVLQGLVQVRQAGLTARVSLLIRPEWPDQLVQEFLAEPATIIYNLDPALPANERALWLALDPTNAISNFIDIGNGANDETAPQEPGHTSAQFPNLDNRQNALYCRNFYRLSPSLTIKANGELATCRLSSAGEGYGNLHEKKLVEILNHFDQAFVYQLHAERRLKEYLPLVDRGLFGSSFTHLCALRSIITLLARKMNEQSVEFSDQAGIQRINREVALLTGHLAK
jgi:sulfatase maturation enzyme AslB (radical SAM superfamily)